MFSWDAQKALKNYEKHGVTFDEASSVFDDPLAVEWEDLDYAGPERRWKYLGISTKARVLLVVYILRRLEDGTETIRIISARQANRAERETYAG